METYFLKLPPENIPNGRKQREVIELYLSNTHNSDNPIHGEDGVIGYLLDVDIEDFKEELLAEWLKANLPKLSFNLEILEVIRHTTFDFLTIEQNKVVELFWGDAHAPIESSLRGYGQPAKRFVNKGYNT